MATPLMVRDSLLARTADWAVPAVVLARWAAVVMLTARVPTGGRIRGQEADVGIVGRAARAGRAVENVLGAELGVGGDAVDGVEGVGDFGLVGGQCVGVVGATVGRGQRQRSNLREQR